MTVATLAAALLRVIEGVKLKAYQDPGGIWTIGFGRAHDVKEGDTCTMEQAEQWLAEDSAALFKLVEGRPLLEAAALLSFGYNCRQGRLASELMILRADGSDDLPYRIRNGPQRDRKGNLLPGLVARRNLEACLIETSREMEGK